MRTGIKDRLGLSEFVERMENVRSETADGVEILHGRHPVCGEVVVIRSPGGGAAVVGRQAFAVPWRH